jgi:predicted transcriptional regulator
MENRMKVLLALYEERTMTDIVFSFNITAPQFNKYILMFFDLHYIIIIYKSDLQVENYRITEKGISVLIANNLIERSKKRNGKAPKNTQETSPGN